MNHTLNPATIAARGTPRPTPRPTLVPESSLSSSSWVESEAAEVAVVVEEEEVVEVACDVTEARVVDIEVVEVVEASVVEIDSV